MKTVESVDETLETLSAESARYPFLPAYDFKLVDTLLANQLQIPTQCLHHILQDHISHDKISSCDFHQIQIMNNQRLDLSPDHILLRKPVFYIFLCYIPFLVFQSGLILPLPIKVKTFLHCLRRGIKRTHGLMKYISKDSIVHRFSNLVFRFKFLYA